MTKKKNRVKPTAKKIIIGVDPAMGGDYSCVILKEGNEIKGIMSYENYMKGKELPKAKINNKQDFVNKYIDLSNKELNGEITEEIQNKLYDYLEQIGCGFVDSTHRPSYSKEHSILGFGDDFIPFTLVLSNKKDIQSHYKEVSIYDIKGMVKPTAKPKTEFKDNRVYYSNKPMEIKGSNITPPHKYTINDLKNNKIAVHLPTQEEWDIAMVFFEENGIKWEGINLFRDRNVTCINSKEAPFWGIENFKKCMCVSFSGRGIEYARIKFYQQEGYTIITLQDLGLEPTAEEEYETEEQIQGGFTKEMIDEVKKNPRKYGLTFTSAEALIKEWLKTRTYSEEEELDSVEDKLEYITQSFDGTGYLINNGEDSIQITSENFQSVKEFLEGKEKIFAEEEVVETNCGDVNIINNSYNDDTKSCTVDLYGFQEVIVKYQDKEKVITREDFADYNDHTNDVNRYIFMHDWGKDLGYAEGSDIWAFIQLKEGKSVKHENDTGKAHCEGAESYDEEGQELSYTNPIDELIEHKDGWKLYKEEEPKKTMTLTHMLLTMNNCKFKYIDDDDDTIYERKDGEILWKWNGITQKYSLADVAKHGKGIVEIIGD